MTTQATVSNETNSRMSHAFETAGRFAEVGVDFRLMKKRLKNAVEDAVLEAERMTNHGKRAMEDAMEDTTYWIKTNPWQSVGYAAVAGFGIGLCLGWFTSRLSARCDH